MILPKILIALYFTILGPAPHLERPAAIPINNVMNVSSPSSVIKCTVLIEDSRRVETRQEGDNEVFEITDIHRETKSGQDCPEKKSTPVPSLGMAR